MMTIQELYNGVDKAAQHFKARGFEPPYYLYHSPLLKLELEEITTSAGKVLIETDDTIPAIEGRSTVWITPVKVA